MVKIIDVVFVGKLCKFGDDFWRYFEKFEEW